MPELLNRSVEQDSSDWSRPARSCTFRSQWEMTLTVTERCLGPIRDIARSQLRCWGMVQAETVVLLGITELLANVLRHAAAKEVRLLVQAGVDGVCVTVTDFDPRLPTVGVPDQLAEAGRGLPLLQALAGGFGIEPSPSGKSVWFRVNCAGERTGPPTDGSTAQMSTGPAVRPTLSAGGSR
ncbi:ATP-binding protein [Streptomyces sodiiphilus]|uniref:ATP-binding protein n=2 Tax=Streptomyces sodiiphilus TaxID=226217 RepID=A0ABN2PSE6_9ACTN